MCGIVGFVGGGHEAAFAEGRLHAMADAVRHRGPDDAGVWFDPVSRVGFGHRRLSIIDLSPAGHQPMRSHSGRYVIVFNGEIYNHRQVRQQILCTDPDYPFRGHSDTEAMLAAFDLWGVANATARLNGMFAFAVFDTIDRVVHLGRDRIGEKPLYFGLVRGRFLFASELRSIAVCAGGELSLDVDALRDYLRFGYIPAPRSMFVGIRKLAPGSLLTVRADGGPVEVLRETPFWSAQAVVSQGLESPANDPDAVAVEKLDSLLRDAVAMRMEADVPLGAFLSGGIDSSIVVSMMQSQASRPVKTFTIGFDEDLFNEAHHAKAVAAHLGTDHTELYLSPGDALRVVPQIPDIFDEPFADVSQIPTFLVAKLARAHVTVALSGDGGDELFGGYGRYFHAQNIWEWLSRIPAPMRAVMERALTSLPIPFWNRLGFVFPRRLTADRMGDRVYKLAQMFGLRDFDRLYVRMLSLWDDPVRALSIAPSPEKLLPPVAAASVGDRMHRMMAWDLCTYLPDDILVKVDRASMAVSLEGRIPLLDHRVVELAWRTPMHQKVRGGQGKWLLREVLYRYVPRVLVDRPKMGFGIPIEHWLRGDLSGWMQDTLSPSALGTHGLLHGNEIARLMREHISGERSWTSQLWTILMFQAWHDQWRKSAVSVMP